MHGASVAQIELPDGRDADAVRVVLVGIELILAQIDGALEREALRQLDVAEALVAPEDPLGGAGEIEVLHLPRGVVAPHASGDESERVMPKWTNRSVMVQLRARGLRPR